LVWRSQFEEQIRTLLWICVHLRFNGWGDGFWSSYQSAADKEKGIMLRLAIIFLVIALIAAFFGFGGVANLSWEGAKILFFIFIVLAVLSFLGGLIRRGT
jgi:uncharacterized membrane protein YtjA (UPF0391 family)